MKSVIIRSPKPDRKAPARQPQPQGLSGPHPHAPPLSPCEDLQVLIAKRAYALYSERGYRGGSAFDDWFEAEREVLSQIPPV
jgi:hypothetical protein